jgi:orotidine-5'-phosphate decarboxylase
MTPFADRLTAAVDALGAPACVGLDPEVSRLPAPLLDPSRRADRRACADAARAFCVGVVDAVTGVVPAVKPQVAYFEAMGAPGVAALEDVVAHARSRGLLVILDAKRGDIGSTARAYAAATLRDDGPIGADAVTLSPYLGDESLRPFLDETDGGKGLFLLVRTSNPGAGAWQAGGSPSFADRVAAWIRDANATRRGASGFGPVGAVIGATIGDEAAAWRAAMPSAWFLVPGYGAQGATAAACLPHRGPGRLGALVVSARGVLYAPSGVPEGDGWQEGVAARARAFAADVAGTLGPSGGVAAE